MFKWNRIIVAIIGVPLLLFVYLGEIILGKNLHALPMLIFINLVIGIGVYEFYSMIKKSGREVYDKFGIFVSLLIPNLLYLEKFVLTRSFTYQIFENFTLIILIASGILVLSYRIFKNQIKGTLEVVSLTLLGIIYISVFFSQIINLYNLSPEFVFALQVLVWVSDTAAGIVGVSIGRKFFKNGFTEISPKKSVEGAIGSLILTGLVPLIFLIIIYNNNKGALQLSSLLVIFMFGMLVSFISQIGDLIESLFKRECGVKDSGTILMGHGGVLDRFDSMIIVIPVTYVLLNIIFNLVPIKYVLTDIIKSF